LSGLPSALDIAQIITAGAAAMAAGVAVWQSRMTQQQLKATMRPWLSVELGNIKIDQDLRVWVPFKNYGQTSAMNVRARATASFDHITKEILTKREYTPGIAMIVPNGSRGISLDLAPESRQKMASGTHYLWLGILIEYEFGKNGKGEYGLIGEYNFARGHDRTESEWSK
jgi:hypothetical protein